MSDKDAEKLTWKLEAGLKLDDNQPVQDGQKSGNANPGSRRRLVKKKDARARTGDSPVPGAEQAVLSVAKSPKHTTSNSKMVDPGNFHPKRNANQRQNNARDGRNQGSEQLVRRKSETMTRDLRPMSSSQSSAHHHHIAHKCSWSETASVSSRSSNELLSGSPGSSRHHHTRHHFQNKPISHSVPGTPNQRSHRSHLSTSTPFDAFLPLCELQAGLKRGEFFEGTLRVNPRRFEDSYISAPEAEAHWDIYLEGRRKRNRALNGDLVIYSLLPVAEWVIHWDVIKRWEEATGAPLLRASSSEIKSGAIDGTVIGDEVDASAVIGPTKALALEDSSVIVEEKEELTRAVVSQTDGNDSIESEGDLAESFHFSTQGFQKEDSVVPTDVKKPLNESSSEDRSGSNVDESHRVNPPSSSRKSKSNDGQNRFNDSKSRQKMRPKKKRAPVEQIHFPKAEVSEETSEHKEETQDEGVASPSSSKKKRNRKKKVTPSPKGQQRSHEHSGQQTGGNHQAQTHQSLMPTLQDSGPDKAATAKPNYKIEEILEHPEWRRFVQRTGKVVGIKEASGHRVSCGTLKHLTPQSRSYALFSPMDSRFPRLMIPAKECPEQFFQRPQDFVQTIYSAKIVSWSEQVNFPLGSLIQRIGVAGDIKTETISILTNESIDFEEYTEEILDDLNVPVSDQWRIPEEEIKARRDFRNEFVFSIDPKTARDLDDALSVKKIGDDLYEVGVHIADVSYYIACDTKVDQKAQSRATSVYLVQTVVPMLPGLLCHKLCSLQAGADRLTFSVVFKMNSSGEVFDEWFGRTVICSGCQLSYEHAQDLIDDPEKEFAEGELPPIFEGRGVRELSQNVNILHKMAVEMRKRRMENGALRLDQTKLMFSLDEAGNPQGFSAFEQRDSHRLVEEFMLLANMAVAHKLIKHFPDMAFLRKHQGPDMRRMEDIVRTCDEVGVKLNAKTAGKLQKTLNVIQSPESPIVQRLAGELQADTHQAVKIVSCVMGNLLSKPFQAAKYLVALSEISPSDYFHYALSVPLYTHFTSPIRRYADLVVHRLLAAAIKNEPPPYKQVGQLAAIAKRCNDKKLSARVAQENSTDLFIWSFLRNLKDSELYDDFVVVSVMDRSLDVLSIKTGLVKRAYFDKQRSETFVSETDRVTFRWKSQRGGFVQLELKVLSAVRGFLCALPETRRYSVRLELPADAIPEIIPTAQ